MRGLTGIAGLVRERLGGRGLLRVAVTGGLRSGGGLLVRLSGLRRHSRGVLRGREALGQRRERLVGVGLGLRRHGGLAGRLHLGLLYLSRGRLFGCGGRGCGGLCLGLCVRLRFRRRRGLVLGRGLGGGVGVGLDVLRLVVLRGGRGSGGVRRLRLVGPLLVRLYVVVGIAEQARGLGVRGGVVELCLRLRHRLCGSGLLGCGRRRDARPPGWPSRTVRPGRRCRPAAARGSRGRRGAGRACAAGVRWAAGQA
ncbi:hypothetical protein WKI71_32330 [Streptomyces sp. MS1.AVA.1]|uniref:Uncharacterized protein n=1 Tax=Streptomyces machairae TaxID=3134109 RepID=A0ABU8URX8_9ACTN